VRKTMVSFAAILVFVGSLATPGYAGASGNSASNGVASITVSGPATVSGGDVVRFVGTITLNADGTSTRRPVAYQLGMTSDGGPIDRIPLRSGVREMMPGRSKTVTRTVTISDKVAPGEYTIYLEVTIDGETLVVTLPISIGAKKDGTRTPKCPPWCIGEDANTDRP